MLKWLEPMLPYLQDAGLAVAVLLLAALLAWPWRQRYAPAEETEMTRPPGRRFAVVLSTYLVFAALVLAFSLPLVYWLNWLDNLRQWSPYHQAWLSFWAIYLVVRLAEGLFVETFAQLGRACPLTRLSRGLLRLAVMLGAAFILIRYQLGFNISVLLTSTAIVTGVVGFAMQGVLGNLLAGMSLHASRSFSVGDWVEVEGSIGHVVLVNWRETHLRTRGGHMVVIPNGKLAEQTIRNFSAPDRLRRHEVPVAASYDDDPGEVVAALLEAAEGIATVAKTPPPDAYLTSFRDFGIEYVLRFWSIQYENRTAIEGEVMRLIWYKFRRRGIEIPFPMSGRMLGNFMEAVHAQRFEMPLASEIERHVDDLLNSDFGGKLMADPEGHCRLNRDELRTVARHLKRVRFTHGETLMRQGEAGESFYVLVDGEIHGSIASAEVDRQVEFDLKRGALLGEMSLLTGLPRSATMRATTDCVLLEFDRGAFSRLLALRDDIPPLLSELAAARAAENAAACESMRVAVVVPPELARDGILHRLRRMLGEWRGRHGHGDKTSA